MSQPWPGRTGNSDRAVNWLIAPLPTGWVVQRIKRGSVSWQSGPGSRLETAHKANRRLVDAGHVVFEHGSFATAAAVYALRRDNASTLPHVSPVGEVLSLSTRYPVP